MKTPRPAILLLSLSLLGARASAALTAGLNVSPYGATTGQVVTVILNVANSSTNAVASILPVINVSSGTASLLSGPSPASLNLNPSPDSGNFIYTYSVSGCGNLVFTASAAGSENSTPVASNQAFSTGFGTCPSPTMTTTPTPYVTATPVVIGPTQIPGTADAKVLGNKLHVGLGNKVGFKVTLPFGGAVRIHIYNRQGQKVKSIEHEGVAGDNFDTWDGRGEQGAYVGAGIYAVHIQGKGLNKVAKIVVIK